MAGPWIFFFFSCIHCNWLRPSGFLHFSFKVSFRNKQVRNYVHFADEEAEANDLNSEVQVKSASGPKLAPPWPRRGPPAALLHRSAQWLHWLWSQGRVPQRQGGVSFPPLQLGSLLIICRLPACPFDCWLKFTVTPKSILPALVLGDWHRAAMDLKCPLHTFLVRSDKVTLYLHVSAPRLETSVLLVVYLVPPLLHFCAFIGDFAI